MNAPTIRLDIYIVGEGLAPPEKYRHARIKFCNQRLDLKRASLPESIDNSP